MSEMAQNIAECFSNDLISMILSCLDDAADLIRASEVSRSWLNIVISNYLAKKLCLQKIPWLASLDSLVEENDGRILQRFDFVSRNPISLEAHENEHKIYTCLLKVLAMPIAFPKECLSIPIGVSSTDHAVESIINTVNPGDRYSSVGVYWSSTGHANPDEPEHIVYLLKNPTCIVTKILIRPFEVFLEPGCPVYSAKSVRFRMGRPRTIVDIDVTGSQLSPFQPPSLEKYVWTYTSPVFPMAQEASLQRFKLPEPTICMGGYLHIELLGRAQREEIDGLYYICLGYVSVMGSSLEPAFNFDMVLSTGEHRLRYCRSGVSRVLESFSHDVLQIQPRFCYSNRLDWLDNVGDQISFRPVEMLVEQILDDDDDDDDGDDDDDFPHFPDDDVDDDDDFRNF